MKIGILETTKGLCHSSQETHITKIEDGTIDQVQDILKGVIVEMSEAERQEIKELPKQERDEHLKSLLNN